MRTLVLRSLRAHRSRLMLTMVAIGISVSFVTASFVLSDSLRNVFGDLSSEIFSEVDAEIRVGQGDFDTIDTGAYFDEASLAQVAGVDGVRSVLPVIEADNTVFAVDDDGELVRPNGPPTKIFSSFGHDRASPFTIVTGEPPMPGQVMLDTTQADILEVDIGDPVELSTPDGTLTFTLSGTLIFGDEEIGVSPYFLLFDLDTAQELLSAPGQLSNAWVTLDEDATFDELRSSLQAALSESLVIVDHHTLVDEQSSQFSTIIDLLQIGLLAFAGITMFVSTFVIANTFAVIVGQQRRQIGLLRAIGARSRQAIGVILAEAFLVGLIASVLGVVGGVGLAEGIQALVGLLSNGGFPSGATEILPRTVMIAVALGIGVTVLSAFLPARKAGQVTPLEAMGSGSAVEPTTRRGVIFRMLNATIGCLGASGKLAVTGVARNPRRVLSTAMSMIVGLALISLMSVLTTSYRSTLADVMSNGFDADAVVTGRDGIDITPDAIEQLLALESVEAGSGYANTEVLHDGEITSIIGFDAATADGVVMIDTQATATDTGSRHSLGSEEVYISDDLADANELAVGDTIAVTFSDDDTIDLTVAGVLKHSNVITADLLVDQQLVEAHARNTGAQIAAIRFVPGVDPAAGLRDIETLIASRPELQVETVNDYIADQEAQVDTLMTLVTGLLALTIIVALTGIANTVALSALERRNEFGLLRAVGMSRRQMGRMVRIEAFVLATFGALVGTTIGLGSAAIIAAVVPDSFIASLQIPVGSLVVYAAVCVACGVLAATLPARRTARLNILDSIASPE